MAYFFAASNLRNSSKTDIYSRRIHQSSARGRNRSVEVPSSDEKEGSFIESKITTNSFYIPQSSSNIKSISINNRNNCRNLKTQKEPHKIRKKFMDEFSSFRNGNDFQLGESSQDISKNNHVIANGRSTVRGTYSLQPLKNRLGNEAKVELKKLDQLEYKFDFKKALPPKANLEEYLDKLKDKESFSRSWKNHSLLGSFQNGKQSTNKPSKQKDKQALELSLDSSTNLQTPKIFPNKLNSNTSVHNGSLSISNKETHRPREEENKYTIGVIKIKKLQQSMHSIENSPLIEVCNEHEKQAKKYTRDSEKLKQAIQRDIEIFNERLVGNSIIANFQNLSTPTVGEIDP